jgi:hypothetical protein
MKDETRKLNLFDKTLGDYSVAGAICSYGDVIEFVDDDPKGIILIDTMRHYESSGKIMSFFLSRMKSLAFFQHDDPRDNLLDLTHALQAAQKHYPNYHLIWSRCVSGMYINLGEDIKFSIGGDLGDLLYLGETPQIFDRETYTIDIATEDTLHLHSLNLSSEDVFFIQSDGLAHNVGLHNFRQQNEVKNWYDYANNLIKEFVNEHKQNSASDLRDKLVEEFDYAFPKDDAYDDVTFAVIKKK